MSELFVKMRKESLWTSVLCVVVGVMFCIWPGEILTVLCRIVGAVLIVAGAVLLIIALKIQEMLGRSVRLIPALICLVLGIWIVLRPGTFIVFIPILIGLLLIYHGVKDFLFCIQVKKGKGARWWLGLIVAALTIVLGVLLVLHTWLAIEIGMIFVGVVLIYDGVSGIWLSAKVSRAAKRMKDDVIDVDYVEE
jgi:uncharacterized membrane protein HdeD (DUF308 family)